MSKHKLICPNCRRENIPKIKVHDLDSDAIVVTEICGFCRTHLSQRTSTNELEKIRKDILRLKERIDNGDRHLITVLNARTLRYNKLRREFK